MANDNTPKVQYPVPRAGIRSYTRNQSVHSWASHFLNWRQCDAGISLPCPSQNSRSHRCGQRSRRSRRAVRSRALRPGEPEETHRARRLEMVRDQIEARGIKDKAVLAALRKVPRHRFVPAVWQSLAYTDGPLPIGEEQTISQPYVVAWMTELIEPNKKMRVLEIGTGSGYQAAILAECVGEVDSIEVVPALGRKAKTVLTELDYRQIGLRIGDGYGGWPERAPYDAILLTAAPPKQIPRPLLDQLKLGGRLVAPIGRGSQSLVRITRTPTGFKEEIVGAVRFVPMTGKAQNE